MSDRSITIWNLLVGFTIVSLIATSFNFPMNTKYNRLKAAAADLEFGRIRNLRILPIWKAGLRNVVTMHLKYPHAAYKCSCSCRWLRRRVKRNRNAIRVALVYQEMIISKLRSITEVRPLLLLSEMSFQTLVLLILIVGGNY